MKATKSQVVLIVGSGLFLGIVLYIYEAFGIDQGTSFSGHSLLERAMEHFHVLLSNGVSIDVARNRKDILC